MRNALPDEVVVQRVDERLSALGNCIACNDYVALVHTDIDKETEERLVKEHFLFRNMNKEQQTRIIGHFERRKVAQGHALTQQGEEGAREFFIVTSGTLEVDRDRTRALARATGAKRLGSLSDLDESDLGRVDAVTREELAATAAHRVHAQLAHLAAHFAQDGGARHHLGHDKAAARTANRAAERHVRHPRHRR